MSWPPGRRGTWVIDLDGVVWLSGQAIEGVPEALARLRGAGCRPLFVTNNAGLTVAEILERLAHIGVEARSEDLVTSAEAAATLLEPGGTVLPVAQGGALEALTGRGLTLVDEAPAGAVVVGYTRQFDYDRLARAATAVRGGARLIGTNEDATYPTPEGLLPGAGSLLIAVATASGAEPEVAGKPYPPMVALVGERADDVVVVVGDRPSTDGLFARRLGVPYALVLSGVTKPSDPPPDPVPDITAPDLAHLVADYLGG
ncbi:MAG TPA: HAD-IIA family hydrolase [Acidimicrobiales bacterium]|nr:HAD-IIA family hydrolase [Acidimicrobiales bacterium]